MNPIRPFARPAAPCMHVHVRRDDPPPRWLEQGVFAPPLPHRRPEEEEDSSDSSKEDVDVKPMDFHFRDVYVMHATVADSKEC